MQRAYEAKRTINNKETIPEFIAARREVKIIIKREKRNKELSIRIILVLYHERRIARDNIAPLKTLDGIVIITDNDMANTMNNYFSSVFTTQQLTIMSQS